MQPLRAAMTETARMVRLEPDLRLVRAPNPSPMTERGTNSYVLGCGAVAVIDPGPDDARHLEALLAALEPGERVSHILVTHSHLDHCGVAPALARRTGAPVLAFGPSAAGRDPDLRARHAAAGLGEGAGIDPDFAPDACIADGARISGADWELRALWTPGHMGNHLCFIADGRAFSGDHVMGWSSSVVAPPEGDMGAYLDSLTRLRDAGAARLYPGHGAPVEDPPARIDALIRHRRARARQLLDALAGGASDLDALTRAVYADTPPPLLGAARRNLLAHLFDLEARGVVRTDHAADGTRCYSLAR